MNNYKLKIYSSIYDVIESYQLKKDAEYHGKFFLTPACSLLLSSYLLILDNITRKVNQLINSMSREKIYDEQFSIVYWVIGVGMAYLASEKIKENNKFINIKYALNKEGIKINGKKISTHNLKKAQTVTYHTQTDTKPIKINNHYDYITKDSRAIIIRKGNTRIIIKEQKTYCLDNDEFTPNYSISVLPNNEHTKEEKRLILQKAYQKYEK